MHGAVLLHKLAAQLPVLQGVELAVVVVVDEPLGEVQKGAQLTQSTAVRLHLGGVVVGSEKGTVVVGGNVPSLVNDVQKARLQDLEDREKRKNNERLLDDLLWRYFSTTLCNYKIDLPMCDSLITQVCQCIFVFNLSEICMIY